MTDELPDGWAWLARYDERKEKKCGGESGEYAALRKAIHAGLIDSMSIGRPKRLAVREVQAEAYLNAHYRDVTSVADSKLTGRVNDLAVAVRDLQRAVDYLTKRLPPDADHD